MGPMYDDREPGPEPTATRESLVDLNVKPPQPNESKIGSRPRRRRLSDIETGEDEPQPQPPARPQCRPSLAVSQTAADEPQFEAQPQPEARRPRLVDITATPDEPELVLKPGRARGAISHPCDDVPGLQGIIDPPRSIGDLSAPPQSDMAAQTQASVDPAGIEQMIAELRARQNFSAALAGGLAAATVGAAVWALITVATSFQIGWMAVGVGFLVGGVARTLGRGVDKSFGYLGAVLSVFGCLLGNFLSLCAIVAGQEGLSLMAVLTHVGSNPAMLPAAMIATFHPTDLLFYGLAIYEGYRFSFRQVTDAEISRLMGRNGSRPDVG